MKYLSWLAPRLTPKVAIALNSFDNSGCDYKNCALYELVFSKPEKSMLRGFYFVEFTVHNDECLGFYQIYIELTCGQYIHYPLPVKSLGVNKRIIWITNPIKRIFISSDTSTSQSFIVQLRKISKFFANSRLDKKILYKTEFTNADINKMSFNERWDLYNDLFPEHVNQNNYKNWIKFKEPLMWSAPVKSAISFQIILIARDDKQLYNCQKLIENLDTFSSGFNILLLTTINNNFHKTHAHRMQHGLQIITTSHSNLVMTLNSHLQINKSEYYLFIDSNLISSVSPHVFNELAQKIQTNPASHVIYFDEDYEYGNKRDYPIFKSQLNIDLLYSVNYISNSCCISYKGLIECDFFDPELVDSFLYNHYLKVSLNSPATITHIPKILVHRIANNYSTALSDSEDSFSYKFQRKLGLSWSSYVTSNEFEGASKFFDTFYPTAKLVTGKLLNSHHVVWALPKTLPEVTIIIPTKDSIDLIDTAVESIFKHTVYPNFEIIIVNNNSEQVETINYLNALVVKYENVRYLDYPYAFNYSAINNYASSQTESEVLIFLNNDVKVINNGWLTELVRQVVRSDIGCVGAKLYYQNNQIQHAGVIMGIGHVAGHSHRYCGYNSDGYLGRLKLEQNYLATTGACLAMRKSVFNEVGGFEEKHLTVAYNDVDLCLKVYEKGYRNLWTPFVELYHYESLTRGKDSTPEKQERFMKEVEYMHTRWHKYINNDPYHNPNFAVNKENFTV